MSRKHIATAITVIAFVGVSTLLAFLVNKYDQGFLNPQTSADSVLGISSSTDLKIASQIKALSEIDDSTYKIEYIYTVTNTGTQNIEKLDITNDIAKTFTNIKFSVEELISNTLKLNSGFNGKSEVKMLAPGNSLAPGKSAQINVTITFDPGDSLGPFENFIEGSGVIPGPSNAGSNSNQNGSGNGSSTSVTPTLTVTATQTPKPTSTPTVTPVATSVPTTTPNPTAKPNKEPKIQSCPAGSLQVATGSGELKRNGKTVSFDFTKPTNTNNTLKIRLITKEGHPDNPTCTASGKGKPQDKECSEYEDFESYDVLINGTKVHSYKDKKNSERQNWWFSGWTTVKLSSNDKYTVTFKHLDKGTGDQALNFKFLACAEIVVVPTQSQDSGSNGGSDGSNDSDEFSELLTNNSASIIFTLMKKEPTPTATPIPTTVDPTVSGVTATPEPTDIPDETPTPTPTGSITPGPVGYEAVAVNSSSDEPVITRGIVLGSNTNSNGSGNSTTGGSLPDTSGEVNPYQELLSFGIPLFFIGLFAVARHTRQRLKTKS